MSDRRDDEELAELVSELEETLRELRAELGPEPPRRPPRGPGGLPRPPTPREMLTFAGDYAIPTTIAFLEANVRALEMLQRVIRFGDPDRTAEAGRAVNERAARMGRDTVSALGEALSNVERELEEGTLPRSGEARTVLEDARRLNRDIGDWIRDAEADADESRGRIRRDEAAESTSVTIDVDSELDSIRDEIRGEDEGDDVRGEDGDGGSGDDGNRGGSGGDEGDRTA